MKLKKIITLGAATCLMFALSHLAVAQMPNGPAPKSQTQASSSGSQEGDEATLEIAPQPGVAMPRPAVKELPSDREFQPGQDDTSSIDPNFRPNSMQNGSENSGDGRRSHRRPYLGMTVAYSTQCYLGMEEHGLEVISLDPNSPAAVAGLKAKTGLTGAGAAVATLSAIIPGGEILANKALGGTGAMGMAGDLIVAVDDRRVRSQGDLDDAMARLKPGDTMYLTVIRPDGNGHKTLKVAIRVGAVGEPMANAAPPIAPGGESFTH
jgi:hypothetical protein